MLKSKNLISKGNKASYNSQVRQINIMQNEEALELKNRYEGQNYIYEDLDKAVNERSAAIKELENTINALEIVAVFFHNLVS